MHRKERYKILENNIIRFRKNKEINIGLVIFLPIMIYILCHVISFFTKDEIPLYEVQPGSLYSMSQTEGMILRQEEMIRTNADGYINYYYSEGARISKNTPVYSIDSNHDMYHHLSGEQYEIKLSEKDIKKLKELVQDACIGLSPEEVMDAKITISTGYKRMLDEKFSEELMHIVTQTGLSSNFEQILAERSGIISYIKDDYTGYTVQDVSAACFQNKDTGERIYTTEAVTAGTEIYKIIYDDTWSIVAPIDSTVYQQLLEKKSVTVTLDNDITLDAPVSCFRKDNDYFAQITLDKYLSNYTSRRFIPIKFNLEQVDGLKIPETAITLKDYYRIPENYIVRGGNKNEKGLLVETYNPDKGAAELTFQEADIFYSANGFSYVDCAALDGSIYISTPMQSTENRIMLYTLVHKLEGAYNINKGYAVFRRVERLKSEDGYVIIKTNTVSGLSAYDHIALNAEGVTEDAVIY